MNQDSKKLFHISFQGKYYGPYFQSLIEEEITAGNLGSDLSIWSDDFAEWTPIGDVPQFFQMQGEIKEKTRLSSDIESRQKDLLQQMALKEIEIVEYPNDMSKDNLEKIDAPTLTLEKEETFQNSEKSDFNPPPSLLHWKTAIRAGILLFCGLACIFVYRYNEKQNNYNKILFGLDASSTEIQSAEKFLNNNSNSPALIYRLKKSEKTLDSLRLFVDWPDQSRVLVHLKGKRKSLVNALFFETYTEVLLRGRTGVTRPISPTKNQKIPPGFYKVELTCLNCIELVHFATQAWAHDCFGNQRYRHL